MNTYLKSAGLAVIGLAALAAPSQAVTVTVDPNQTWLSYVNASELPSNGGAYAFGFPYVFALSTASFSGDDLTLQATQIGNVNDPVWWVGGVSGPGAVGNKITSTSVYVQPADGTYTGVSLTFEGSVLSNTLVSGYSVQAFILDFAPDYSSNVGQFAPLGATGDFSITLDTIADPARHVQYGFIITGQNVWETDVASKGSIVIAPASAIPEPSSFAALAGLATLGLAASRRRRA